MNGLRKTLLPLLVATLWLAGHAAAQSSYSLRSPDKRIEVRIRIAGGMQYDVLVNGRVLLLNSTLSINVDRTQLGRNVKVQAVKEGSVDRMIDPQVRQKFAKIRENYNELRIDAEDGLAVVFRAYKVDFMQRDDQVLINFYHNLARETAKRKLLLDFHGVQRSATMTRTWPNLIGNEGVKGMENNNSLSYRERKTCIFQEESGSE